MAKFFLVFRCSASTVAFVVVFFFLSFSSSASVWEFNYRKFILFLPILSMEMKFSPKNKKRKTNHTEVEWTKLFRDYQVLVLLLVPSIPSNSIKIILKTNCTTEHSKKSERERAALKNMKCKKKFLHTTL